VNNVKLLIDFGSTYTKVTAVDLEKLEVVAQARVPSTVETDVTVGLEQALGIISGKVDITSLKKTDTLACSSAAGGLRMVCIGFVPELTSKAANMAALGAGAKVVGLFSYKLTRREIAEIETISPDIVLLCGGTDGGDDQVIVHNSRMLSQINHAATSIIVAGNKTTYDEIGDIFKNDVRQVIFTRNVMPEIGVLDVEPCNKEIREIFMKNIIQAKGIAKAQAIVRDVIMPTPSAVLEAAKLIASGCGDVEGLGELVILDPGGATTDVHSVARGTPAQGGVILSNILPEPYVKRTVEGNLGLKHNIETLRKFAEGRDSVPGFNEIVQSFCDGKLPNSREEIECHLLLSRIAVEVAMNQHAGRIEKVYGPMGDTLIQHGKDLTGIKTVIGTGGPIIDSRNPRHVLEGVLFQKEYPSILKPVSPDFFLDTHYILYAIGLLSQIEPSKALVLAKKYLKRLSPC
jgi:uncharacterized protein (TIGR01319 family)